MNGKLQNNLVVIENGQLDTYVLDDKLIWEVGRPSTNNHPDIMFHSATVSRKHGKFHNMDGVWFYLDYNGKNGTVYKDKKIKAGARGRIKPVMLEDGDVLIFGGGEEAAINNKTIWARYSTKSYGEQWSVVDTKGRNRITISDGINSRTYENPMKGTMIELEYGSAIYMGDVSYVVGSVIIE